MLGILGGLYDWVMMTPVNAADVVVTIEFPDAYTKARAEARLKNEPDIQRLLSAVYDRPNDVWLLNGIELRLAVAKSERKLGQRIMTEWFTLADVEAAEARIRRECPSAILSRSTYDGSLFVRSADRSELFVVYQDPDPSCSRPGVIGDLDKTIAALNAKP